MKGLLLAGWLAILLWLAGLAATGQVAVLLPYEAFQPSVIRFGGPAMRPDQTRTPSEYLEGFLARFENPPPIAVILDAVAPNWRDIDVADHWPEDSGFTKSKWVNEKYQSLFSKSLNVTRGYVNNTNIDPRGQDLEPSQIAPQLFLGITYQSKVRMPSEVVAWILSERQRIADEKDRLSLLNVFLLLAVLGAFGSLIFLTRDYIIRENKTTIAAYIFRPIFGILLAVAVFVVDILAHSLISTSDILQIRHESLYVLALAAGLLSEQAYSVLLERAGDALNQLQQEEPAPSPQPAFSWPMF